jgi:hypothetical protein
MVPSRHTSPIQEDGMKLPFELREPLTAETIRNLSGELARLTGDLVGESAQGVVTPRLIGILAAIRHIADDYCGRATVGLGGGVAADTKPAAGHESSQRQPAYL